MLPGDPNHWGGYEHGTRDHKNIYIYMLNGYPVLNGESSELSGNGYPYSLVFHGGMVQSYDRKSCGTGFLASVTMCHVNQLGFKAETPETWGLSVDSRSLLGGWVGGWVVFLGCSDLREVKMVRAR